VVATKYGNLSGDGGKLEQGSLSLTRARSGKLCHSQYSRKYILRVSHFALPEYLLLFPAQSTNVGHFLAIIIIKT